MGRTVRKRISITPSARRLVTSLRDIGYSFPTALADLVDNSISAAATRVDIGVHFNGRGSHVLIADNGSGMTERELDEGLRFGTRREYQAADLGRYGLGLKTASISQGRRLTVVTRRAPRYRRFYSRVLDLDHVARRDRWEVLEGLRTENYDLALEYLQDHPGTVDTRYRSSGLEWHSGRQESTDLGNAPPTTVSRGSSVCVAVSGVECG